MTRSDKPSVARLPWRHVLAGAAVLTLVAALAAVLVRHRTAAPRPGEVAATPTGRSAATTTPAGPPSLAVGDLLRPADLRMLGPGRWRVAGTDTAPSGRGPSGTGPGAVCRKGRLADPAAAAALAREYRSSARPRRTVVQTVEVSTSRRRAARTFRTTLGWYAGCRAGRLQLLEARPVAGVGARAEVLTLRLWRRPVATIAVAVARIGTVTTSTLTVAPAATRPAPARTALTLTRSMRRLCRVAGVPGCRLRPQLRDGPLPRSGTEPGLLTAVDLPPVGAVGRPWVGTRPAAARTDRSATSCQHRTFGAAGATRGRTRTFLIPGARLPVRFGLTETYGVFAGVRGARGFLAAARGSVAGCEKRDLATRVGPERRVTRASSPLLDGSAWDLATQVSARQTVRFRLGLVRVGRRVARLTFTPAAGGDMSAAAFDALLRRAGERL